MSEIVYQNDGVLCSFPYHFELRKEGDKLIGEEISYIYQKIQLTDEEKKKVEEELSKIAVTEGGRFYLDGEDINYQFITEADSKECNEENEVNIRRNFIENFLEAEDELDALVLAHGGRSRKTEFATF